MDRQGRAILLMVIIIRGARPDADVLRRRDQIVAALRRMHAMGEKYQLRVANVFLAVSSSERSRKQHVMNATEVNAAPESKTMEQVGEHSALSLRVGPAHRRGLLAGANAGGRYVGRSRNRPEPAAGFSFRCRQSWVDAVEK